MNANPTHLLTAAQTAKLLGCSRGTLDRLTIQGKFPAPIRLGAQPRWPSTIIESFIASKMAA